MANKSSLWWLGVGEKHKRRFTRKERLELLSISEDDFELYRDLSLKYREPCKYSQHRSDGSWPQIKHRWNDRLILAHLCGHIAVAIPFSARVDQIVLDIDYHANRKWAEVEKTVLMSTSAIPGEPIIYRSSESEGIRMIWFLKELAPRQALCDWTKQMLRGASVVVKSGKCEVRLGSEPDRLPFGRHSMLLDRFTLEPRYELDLQGTLCEVDNHRHFHALETPDLTDHRPINDSERDFKKIVTECMRNGLPRSITTNACLTKLAWHGRCRLGLEKDELKVFLQDWITKNHNGNSDRINRGNIDSVYKQIDRIVQNIKATPGCSRSRIESVGLCREEIHDLLRYPSNFKMIGGLFRVLCFTKARLLLKLKINPSMITEEEKRGTNKWGRVFDPDKGIPNGAGFFTISIDLSKQLLRLLRVPNAENVSPFVEELERLGILSLKRQAWPDGHKARQYWVNFQFYPTGKPLSEDFDQAIWEVLGFQGIKKRFTAHQAKRIASVMETQERREPTEKPHLAMV